MSRLTFKKIFENSNFVSIGIFYSDGPEPIGCFDYWTNTKSVEYEQLEVAFLSMSELKEITDYGVELEKQMKGANHVSSSSDQN